MKIIKTTHYRNHEESETSDYTLFESNNQQEVTKKFKRTCELLIHFLQQIPKSIGQYLQKNAYWVKVTVTD